MILPLMQNNFRFKRLYKLALTLTKNLLLLIVIILQHLHTYESISSQRHVISLDGPVVTASGFKDKLAVVTHASDCLSSNDQVGSFFAVAVASEFGWSSVALVFTMNIGSLHCTVLYSL